MLACPITPLCASQRVLSHPPYSNAPQKRATRVEGSKEVVSGPLVLKNRVTSNNCHDTVACVRAFMKSRPSWCCYQQHLLATAPVHAATLANILPAPLGAQTCTSVKRLITFCSTHVALKHEQLASRAEVHTASNFEVFLEYNKLQ
eukprot:5706353-Amphidinium_carterae.1